MVRTQHCVVGVRVGEPARRNECSQRPFVGHDFDRAIEILPIDGHHDIANTAAMPQNSVVAIGLRSGQPPSGDRVGLQDRFQSSDTPCEQSRSRLVESSELERPFVERNIWRGDDLGVLQPVR